MLQSERAELKSAECRKCNILVISQGTPALPDIYTLVLGHCAPLGSHAYISGKDIRQSTRAWDITYTYIYSEDQATSELLLLSSIYLRIRLTNVFIHE